MKLYTRSRRSTTRASPSNPVGAWMSSSALVPVLASTNAACAGVRHWAAARTALTSLSRTRACYALLKRSGPGSRGYRWALVCSARAVSEIGRPDGHSGASRKIALDNMRYSGWFGNYQLLLVLISMSRTSLISSLPLDLKMHIISQVERMESEFLAKLRYLIGSVLWRRQLNISHRVHLIYNLQNIQIGVPGLLAINCIDGITSKKMLAVCASCKCCERHQTDRPGVLQFAKYVRGHPSLNGNDDPRTCRCPCRHTARFLAE
jgi:hypothetical protein